MPLNIPSRVFTTFAGWDMYMYASRKTQGVQSSQVQRYLPRYAECRDLRRRRQERRVVFCSCGTSDVTCYSSLTHNDAWPPWPSASKPPASLQKGPTPRHGAPRSHQLVLALQWCTKYSLKCSRQGPDIGGRVQGPSSVSATDNRQASQGLGIFAYLRRSQSQDLGP